MENIMSHPTNIKEQFIQLRAEGWSYDKIALEINVSKSTQIEWAKELKKELYTAEYNKATELMEQSHLNRAAALKKAAEQLDRVVKAIEAKDLNQENLKTLLAMQEKLEHEMTDMVYSTKKSLDRCQL
jgi:transposase